MESSSPAASMIHTGMQVIMPMYNSAIIQLAHSQIGFKSQKVTHARSKNKCGPVQLDIAAPPPPWICKGPCGPIVHDVLGKGAARQGRHHGRHHRRIRHAHPFGAAPCPAPFQINGSSRPAGIRDRAFAQTSILDGEWCGLNGVMCDVQLASLDFPPNPLGQSMPT